MAKIPKELVTNLINAQRQKGMTDKEIFDKLARRKDGLGDNVRTLIGRYENDESPDAKGDTAKFFGLDITQVKGNSQQGSGNKKATVGDKLKSYAVSTATGIGNVGAGLLQPIAIAGDTVNKGINKAFGTNLSTGAEARVRADNEALNAYSDKQRLKANRKGGDAPRLIGEIGASLPAFMYGAGGSTMGARVADQAVRGAAVGGLQLTQEGSDPNQRLYNMAGGAVGGAAGQAGGELIGAGASKVIGKAVNAKRGKLKPKYQEVDNLSKQYDVPTSPGDLIGKGIVQNTESHLNRLPVVGNSKFMNKQADATEVASKKVVNKLKDTMTSTDFKAINKIEKAANAGDRNAKRVLGVINNAGDDTNKVIQASLEVTKWRKKQIAKNLYGNVAKEVEKTGNDIVDVANTKAALTKVLDEQNASISPNKVVVREVSEMLENLDDAARPLTFKNIRELRSKLGNLADEYGNPTGKADNFASSVFSNARQAVTKDLDNFAASSGGAVKAAYNKADKFYAKAIANTDKSIERAIQSPKPDEIYGKFAQPRKGDNAQILVDNLDKKGQDALRLRMAEDAMDKAWHETTESFSPAKFAGEFERLSEPYGRVFTGEAKKEMDGFVKLMRHVERAGSFRMNPPTGVRATDIGIAATAIASPTTAATGAGIAFLAKTLLTTKAGKNLLLAASELPPTQKAAFDNIMKIATKLASSSGSRKGRDTAEKVAGTKVSEKDSASLSSF
ncbi:hypothetical protein Q8P09_12175 [Psychrobacter faecalis]|uniref:DNA transfer protein n=1 Tax=Psychrobacter faecalis TaxID=180588 RepID=A0ABT9HJ75_9GAMM|nr:hypothetical protein [Psychrobacter faecalis]MDP4545831.1 hypothetical protein [Psychrobacter faecalis]